MHVNHVNRSTQLGGRPRMHDSPLGTNWLKYFQNDLILHCGNTTRPPNAKYVLRGFGEKLLDFCVFSWPKCGNWQKLQMKEQSCSDLLADKWFKLYYGKDAAICKKQGKVTKCKKNKPPQPKYYFIFFIHANIRPWTLYTFSLVKMGLLESLYGLILRDWEHRALKYTLFMKHPSKGKLHNRGKHPEIKIADIFKLMIKWKCIKMTRLLLCTSSTFPIQIIFYVQFQKCRVILFQV